MIYNTRKQEHRQHSHNGGVGQSAVTVQSVSKCVTFCGSIIATHEHLDSVSSLLHFILQTTLLLTFLTQSLLQLLLLLPHRLDASLQL